MTSHLPFPFTVDPRRNRGTSRSPFTPFGFLLHNSQGAPSAATGYDSRVTSYDSRVTSYELRVRVTSYESRVTFFVLPFVMDHVTDAKNRAGGDGDIGGGVHVLVDQVLVVADPVTHLGKNDDPDPRTDGCEEQEKRDIHSCKSCRQ